MKLNLKRGAILAGFMAVSVVAQESAPATKTPGGPEKEKLSYALGMNLGLQIKRNGVDADVNIVAQAIKDVLEGKSTGIQESEIRSILKQVEAAARLKQFSKNVADGEAFLAKNAKAEGVTVLPDGLQYRVIATGTGENPKRTEILTLNFRGHWPDGKEFRHEDRLEIPFFGCTKGLAEALSLMKVGSKWEIFVPYHLAYGHLGERTTGFGSVLIYEMELVAAESETAHPNQHHSAGRPGHTLDEELLPAKVQESTDNLADSK